tara:strand:+ start:1784 stop:2080 length:297 start_codon:yes stop_codon:yes gene_type:complete
MKKNLDGFIEKATENIMEDRAATKSLLMNLMKHLHTGEDKHREFGLIAAKYLETLQRSNEQLVKLASLLQKKQKGDDGISEEDRQELFDMINSTDDDG